MVATMLLGIDLGQEWFPPDGNLTIIVPGSHLVKIRGVVFPAAQSVRRPRRARPPIGIHSIGIHSGDGSPGDQGR